MFLVSFYKKPFPEKRNGLIVDIFTLGSFPFAGIILIRWIRVVRFWTLRCYTTPLTTVFILETSSQTVK
jgi:hypothetical protein